MVINVHERRIPAEASEVGRLLDELGGPQDQLWPPHWPPMIREAPLAVGVRAHHGPIRYRVTDYRPGRSVEYTFADSVGLRGTHRFEIEPVDDGTCVLRHVVQGRPSGSTRVVWPLAIRWLHDAVLEDLLDCAERAVGAEPSRPASWSPWVRTVRRLAARRLPSTAVDVPRTELLATALSRVDASDAFSVARPRDASDDPQVWADAVFRSPPPVWAGALGLAREAAVRLVGIERGDSHAFDTVARTDDEVLVGVDQRHLGFRASVLLKPERVVLSTVVELHNARGRLYWGLVRHVHPIVVRSMLSRAATRMASGALSPAR